MLNNKIIDAHVHPAGPSMESAPSYEHMERLMLSVSAEEQRVPSILERMDKHGVHQAIGLVSQGISILPEENHKLIQVARDYPTRFPAVLIGFTTPEPDHFLFDPKKAAEEVDSYFQYPEVKGVGEWALMGASGMEDWPSLWSRYRPIMDVLAEHRAVAHFHTGSAPYLHRSPRVRDNGRPGWVAHRALWFSNPVFLDDVATEYPEVTIIIGHIGVQGFYYYGTYADMALLVAARHDNVYLETSSCPYEVLEKAVRDPAIGAAKLVFGTDTPAPFGHYRHNGDSYPSYSKNPPATFPDHYKYDLEAIEKLNIHDRDKDLILGGNIARIYGL
jgi:predicted TIM-barrel fold metal-dependent hydrolase